MKQKIAVVVMLMIVAALVSGSPHSDLNACYLIEHEEPSRCIAMLGSQFADTLGISESRPMEYVIVQSVSRHIALTSPGTWAWARKTADERGCRMDFLPDASRDPETIAHEVCHCRYDWEILTKEGPALGGSARIELAERRAKACAAWLVDEERRREIESVVPRFEEMK